MEDILASSRGESRRAEGIGERLLGESLMSEDPIAAIRHVEASARVLDSIGALNELAKAQATLAELHRLTGDVAAARKLLDSADAIFRKLGTLDERARVQAALAALDAT